MGSPLAYFITWTCYATWLHGDGRGSVDRDHNLYGHERLPADHQLLARDAGAALREPEVLGQEAREVVARAIREHCAFKGWRVLGLNVRTNHVHVVVASAGVEPEVVMTQLKAWATRALREAGLAPEGKVWTKHGSTRYLWDHPGVEGAVDYVTRLQ